MRISIYKIMKKKLLCVFRNISNDIIVVKITYTANILIL